VSDQSVDVRWAVSRWEAEVKNRPLRNVHRRALDTTWRQVIRHYGGDDVALCGPTHDELTVAASVAAKRRESSERAVLALELMALFASWRNPQHWWWRRAAIGSAILAKIEFRLPVILAALRGEPDEGAKT